MIKPIPKYIVATDYDGTLKQGGVSEDTVDMIRQFRAAGHLFGVVTGRVYANGYAEFRKQNLFPFDFIISHNGAVGYDEDGNILFARSVDGGQSWKDSTLAKELVIRCLTLSGGYCGINFEKSRLLFHSDILKGLPVDKDVYSPLSCLDQVTAFNMINVRCNSVERASEMIALLKAEFGNLINPSRNSKINIDISAGGVDKSSGIAQYASLMGIPAEHIWTAGNNYNDLTMLQAYHGCAMRSGIQEAARVAELVCDTVGDLLKHILQMDR